MTSTPAYASLHGEFMAAMRLVNKPAFRTAMGRTWGLENLLTAGGWHKHPDAHEVARIDRLYWNTVKEELGL